jgi:(1->4)-alpha-D-glucan 1-alpha-D-glucosylmutase
MIEAFHAENARRLQDRPNSMIATMTHDSKRSEDVRARINALSELTDEWRAAVSRWGGFNAPHRTMLQDGPAPSPRDEYLLYQTLVGAWPAALAARRDTVAELPDDFVPRIRSYMTKALREAKQKSSWICPDADYEDAVSRFIGAIVDDARAGAFLKDFRPFASKIARLGMLNGLGQTALKLTLPGVPDFYQGSELWDLRLVDPDNRGSVDFAARADALASLPDGHAVPRSMARWLDGSVKLALIARLLRHRRDHAALYRRGAYVPLAVEGPGADHICAFARVGDDHCLVVCVARLMAPALLPDGIEPPFYANEFWAGTDIELTAGLAGQEFTDLMSARTLAARTRGDGGTLGAATLFADFPVAVLTAASRNDRP